MTVTKNVLGLATLLCCAHAIAADTDNPSWTQRAVSHVKEVWQQGQSDMYLPLHAHHVRSNYSDEQINEFRENTWGLGYGRSRYTETGNWEGVYGMAFLDSNSDIEPIVGYGYEWVAGQPKGVHAGAGYTALVTARARFAHYFPIPGLLPMASVGYKQVNLNSTYVPGANGFGQIFFFWSTVSF